MPKGCEPRGTSNVLVTVRVAGLITLIVELRLLLTHKRPLLAIAIERGAAPTESSASLANVTASKALMLSLSWLTTHIRGAPVDGFSTRTLFDAVGTFSVGVR